MHEVNGGPRVTLVSSTPYPLETLFALWHASRTNAPSLTASEIADAYATSQSGGWVSPRFWIGKHDGQEPFHTYFDREVLAIAGLDFPLKETIKFTFVFDNVSITWREQAVRQRRATPWSQTSRTRDLRHFVDQGWFEEPASIKANPVVHERFLTVIASIQDFYRLAVGEGIHLEDARALQPTCQTHRIAFSYDARVLEQTAEDRLCFIAQAELWTPVLRQMRALLTRIDARLALLFHPPCVKNGKYRYCPFEHENERRLDGRDPMGPCPLYTLMEHPKRLWEEFPLRENAEAQYARVGPLWPDDIRTAVTEYIARASAAQDMTDAFAFALQQHPPAP